MSKNILDGLELPYELIWVDEFSWTGVLHNFNFTLGGQAVIEESKIAVSRPITLSSSEAWILKSDLRILFDKATATNKVMTLILNDDRIFNVMFRHYEENVIIAEPTKSIALLADTDYYKLTLKLVTV